MSNDGRETTFSFKYLLSDFNKIGGYYNLYNNDLAIYLKELNLLGEDPEEANKVDDQEKIHIYKKWSFTVSFLQMLNAWQWLFAGILLRRNSYLIAQSLQMYYYAIYFSYGSFLSAHFKGKYTLADVPKQHKDKKRKNNNNDITDKVEKELLRVLKANGRDTESNVSSSHDHQNIEQVLEPARREIWLVVNKTDKNYIYVATRKEAGKEHERRARWYYGVFNTWESKINILYPDVRCFNEGDDDKTFHSDERNEFTYRIEHMADELCSLDENSALTNEGIICLWRRNSSALADMFSKEFWVLQHIKVVVDLHTKLLEGYIKESPYTEVQ